MGTLQDRLNGIIQSIELDGEIPTTLFQRWAITSSVKGGIIFIGSDYLLLPVAFKKILRDDLHLDVNTENVEKVCSLGIEKIEGQPLIVTVTYQFRPRLTWRPKG